jgi:hypothetical protein
MPHFLHLSISLDSGGKYPREFIFLDFLRILAGQNSMQIPQPLQYRSSMNSFGIISFPNSNGTQIKADFQDE